MDSINRNKKTEQAWNTLYDRLEKDGLLADKQKRSGHYSLQSIGWAAVLAVLCVSVVTAFFLTRSSENQMSLLTLQNGSDETTLVTTLEDGSMIYLADNSQLKYPEHFAKEKREVSLEGNALFEVSGNRQRPFLIETEKIQIEVIGTSFHVKNSRHIPFELSVQKGEVKVTIKNNNESVHVKAGETVSLSEKKLHISTTQDTEQFVRYIKRVQFKDVRLGDILRAINQQEDVHIITSPLLEERILTVSFYDNSPEMIAELICSALKLKYTKENGFLIITEL